MGLLSHMGETDKMVDRDTVVRIMEAALPSHGSKVAEIVDEHLEARGVVKISEVKDLRIALEIGAFELKGAIRDICEDFKANFRSNPEQHIVEGLISGTNLRKT